MNLVTIRQGVLKNNIMRTKAKRLTKKETMHLIKEAFLVGEKVGRENAKNIHWTTRPKIEPDKAFESWREQIAMECQYLAEHY